MVSEHALPNAPKSADKIEGAMIAGGDMLGGSIAGTESSRGGERDVSKALTGVLRRAVEIADVTKTHDDCLVLTALA